MPDGGHPDPREQDIVYGDRRISRPDASLPDWEVPDSSYRPVPIVWFTGAMLLEFLAVWLVTLVLWSQAGLLVMAMAALVTIVVGRWTWRRGMAGAGAGWKAATLAMFAVQLGLVWVVVGTRTM